MVLSFIVLVVVEQGEHHPVKMVLIASQLRRVRVRVCACVMCVCVCTCKQVCICACLRARARVCKVCRLLACARPFFSFFFSFFFTLLRLEYLRSQYGCAHLHTQTYTDVCAKTLLGACNNRPSCKKSAGERSSGSLMSKDFIKCS